MQYKNSEYDPEKHDRFRALCVKQPYADMLVKAAYRDDEGNIHAVKSIEVRGQNTNYRGEVLVCSSNVPQIPGRQSGVTLGFVELYGIKPLDEFTDEDWENTGIPEGQRPRKGYGWLMRNPRRVVEMPTKGQLGIFNLVYTKDDITEYPQVCHVDEASWRLIKRKIKNENGSKEV